EPHRPDTRKPHFPSFVSTQIWPSVLLLGGPGSGNGRLFPCLSPLLEALQYREERGDEQYRQTGRRNDAAQYAEPQRDPAVGPGAGRQHQWHDPKPEGKRGHQDGPESQARVSARRFAYRFAVDEPSFAR